MVLYFQEFNIEKLQMIEAEKQKIKKDYERKESQVEVKKKMYVGNESGAWDGCAFPTLNTINNKI
jgi:hypothetical protein